jgi:hypothetical protein
MTKAAYMQQRAPYRRPQAMLWADNYGSLVAYPSTVNSIPNSNFENATTNWIYPVSSGSAGTITSVVDSSQTPPIEAVVGTYVAKSTATAAAGRIGILHNGGIITVEAGQTYTYSIYVRDGNTSELYASHIEWRSGSTVLSTTSGTNTTVGTAAWTRVSVSGTAPATADNVRVYTYSSTSPNSIGVYVYFDAALFQEGSTVNSYVEGTSSASYFYAPTGYEVYDSVAGDNFLILSDHNRQPIDFKPQRIEKRERMINGRMRSYHVADKLTISTSWQTLPSRSFATDPAFSPATGTTLAGTQYTVDGGAGGADLLKWYEDHQGPFWVYLAYDKPQNFATDRYNHLDQYSEVIQMYISDFSWTVEKRGGSTFDFWNVSVSLEEV